MNSKLTYPGPAQGAALPTGLETAARGREALADEPRATSAAFWRQLGAISGLVFLEFLAMGLPLSVLPVHIHDHLGFGSFIVGLLVGLGSWATLFSRHAAGSRTDREGPGPAAVRGLFVSAGAGIAYATSLWFSNATASLAVLALGRVLLGFGESLVITGALAWGIGLAGRQRTGTVMAWVGMAMYGALAVGAPLGAELAQRFGFAGVAIGAAVAPIAGVALARLIVAVPPVVGKPLSLAHAVKLIWVPGVGLSLGALGFGAILAFAPLLYRQRGWPHASLVVTTFGVAYVLARVLFGKWPDRFGGGRVALGSATVAALGQGLIAIASSSPMATLGAAMAGFGFSLAFPSFGLEAMRRVPPEHRGVALGAYTAFFDATLGIGVPALGLLFDLAGSRTPFLLSALSAVGSLAIAFILTRRASDSGVTSDGK